MKRQHIAIAAALVASLMGGSYGVAQANTNDTAATQRIGIVQEVATAAEGAQVLRYSPAAGDDKPEGLIYLRSANAASPTDAHPTLGIVREVATAAEGAQVLRYTPTASDDKPEGVVIPRP